MVEICADRESEPNPTGFPSVPLGARGARAADPLHSQAEMLGDHVCILSRGALQCPAPRKGDAAEAREASAREVPPPPSCSFAAFLLGMVQVLHDCHGMTGL